MAERAPAVGLRRAFGDGRSAGDREARRPPAAVPAAPPVPSRQAPRPAFPKRPAGVDPSVDGLRAHAHERIVRPQDAQPAADGRRRPAATQPFGHPRPQAVVRQPVGLSWLGSPAVGLALRGPGDVVAAGPWPRLQSFRPVRAVRLVLVGREPCVALDLPADAGRAAARHRADPACWTTWVGKYHYTRARMEDWGAILTDSGRQWGTDGTEAIFPWWSFNGDTLGSARIYYGSCFFTIFFLRSLL